MKTPGSGLYADNPALPLLQALVSFWGITSANGNLAGTTIVCDDLVNEPSYADALVKVLDGGAAGQIRQVLTHVGNTLTVSSAFTNAAGAPQQIVASTRFVVLSGPGVAAIAAAIAALQADVGDASSGALGSLYAILGNWTVSLLTAIGYEGATALANKLTAARAAFLDASIASRAAPGDAMALTPAERLIVQALILTDATPFAGADILNIVNALYLAPGIAAWLARALPANNVSLSEAIRYIAEVKPEWAARTSATHTTTGATEETILTTAYTVPGLFYFNLTLRNMVAGDDFTLRVYKRVDGVNYDLKSEQNFVGAQTIDIYELEGLYTDGTEFIRVTIQRNSATNRAFPYSYNCVRQPVG